jgi:hypothetical protein
VEALRTPPQALGKRRRPQGSEHELLDLEPIVGVSAAVDHVHQRDRQEVGLGTAEVPVQGQSGRYRRGPGHGQGDPEDGVRSQPAPIHGPVELDHDPVDVSLVQGVDLGHRRRDLVLDVPARVEHASPPVPLVVPVPELQGLVPPGRRA